EQASGIEQVNAAVSQMDEMTQQNAALVEESAAAAQALEHQADELARQMGFFNVGAQAASRHEAMAKRDAAPPRPAAKPVIKATPVKAKVPARPATPAAARPTAKAAAADDWKEF
ncbi:MAG: hypothetical protein AB1918_12375, partial [Pseudomonadota bacterium]